jgi:glycosyltransferase involved in cell wall biosynthesis
VKILFLGETYRADAQTWIQGIQKESGILIDTDEIKTIKQRPIRIIQSFFFIFRLLWGKFFGPKYDIVLAERSTSYGFFALFTNAKVKIIAQQGISDIFPLTEISKFYKRILQRAVYTRVDLIHAWGNAMVPAMLKSGANPNNIMVLAKGLDLSRYTFVNHLAQNPLPLKAIVTRSLEKDYQHWNIIDAVSILKSKGILLEVNIVGGGSLLEILQQRAIDKGVSELIHFLGRIPNDELPKLLTQCPLYISVPTTEGVSSSLFEAMAAGCFPIVTDLPGNRAFIHPNQNGNLVPVNNAQALANAIEKFLENPDQYEAAIVNNRKLIDDKVDREKNMKVFWEKYQKLVKNKT